MEKGLWLIAEAALTTISEYRNNDITFFGVSGCGKTRAVVEMLAQNWGFYLNGSQADRGSKDVTTLFVIAQEMPTRYLSSDKLQNGLNVEAITSCLLISRLMVLQYLCPGAFDEAVSDVFDDVFRRVLNAYHDQTPGILLLDLKRLPHKRFHMVQGQISLLASNSPTNKLLVVLDEAQTLSDHGRECFVSRADSRDRRSILSPTVRGPRNIFECVRDYCVVTCGTGIDADELEVLSNSGGIASNVDKLERRILDFPGEETENQVAMYLNNLEDTMDEDDRARLHTLIPEAAVQELFSSFETPRTGVLSTRFPMRRNLFFDIKRMLDKVARDPSKYGNAVELKEVLKQTVVLRASLGLSWSLREEEPIVIESAFGRLHIAADKAATEETISAVIDEPFVFQTAYNFIKTKDEGFYKLFRNQYRGLQDPQSEGKIFERNAPLDLIFAFHKKQLKQELFSIPKPAVHKKAPETPIPRSEPVTFPRHMFKHPATIVGWEDYEWGARYRTNLNMGDFLEAHHKHGSRRGGSMTRCLAGIYPGDVEEARLTVHETRLKAQLPNLITYCRSGKYLSLIYVHLTINKTPREGWDCDDL
ncbi:hypothetical protein EDD11_007314 [Mortierella claussenii]|nr:hypothetical protein EDD11_007314 [Mortierella claussenii]